MDHTDSLPRVEAEFMVLAPEGGFRRPLRSFDVGVRHFLDIEVENPYGQKMWLRIAPDRNEVVLDPKYDELYLFNKASAIFITEKDGEELTDKPAVDVWVSINTDVEIEGMPAGRLKMWEIPHSHQLGA